jgi:hypothetical protein
MTPTTSVRVAAVRRLLDLVQQQLPDVQVAFGWPGADLENEAVWFDGVTEGTVEPGPGAMKSGRKRRQDRFTITLQLAAGSATFSAEEAAERVQELYNAVENVCADNPTLDDLDGVQHAVQNGTTTGPEPVAMESGYSAFIEASVEVLAHLH